MIPDKLYIGTVTLSSNAPSEEHLLPDWHLRPNPKVANVEYIRKDALIEWLLKGIEMSEICHSEYGDACAQAYQAVIDKLNSM